MTLKEVVEAGRIFAESSQVFPGVTQCTYHAQLTVVPSKEIFKKGGGLVDGTMLIFSGDLALLFHWMLWTLSLRSFARVGCTV